MNTKSNKNKLYKKLKNYSYKRRGGSFYQGTSYKRLKSIHENINLL